MSHADLISRLARAASGAPEEGGKIVLLVLDGLGDIRTADQPETPLEAARLPQLDSLASRSALGRLLPVALGVTPGSGPGHLALFGHDPTSPAADIGRGVLEALGEGLDILPGDVAARGNFATADGQGRLTDRRAGRIPTAECRRLCAAISAELTARPPRLAGLSGGAGGELNERGGGRLPPLPSSCKVTVAPGEGYRFVLHLRGPGLSAEVADTDPQELGVPPLVARALREEAEPTAALVREAVTSIERVVAGEPRANRVLLRGFSQLPHLPSMMELYRLRCCALAAYPLYRGVAAACGMEVVPSGQRLDEALPELARRWDHFDYFFIHVKQTDAAGEDGDFAAKVRVLEEVDAALPRLLALGPAVLAVTGDHSTPVPLRSHAWHPVPLLLHSARVSLDGSREFTERAAARGDLGTFPSCQLLGLLLANAGRLAKYGA